MHGIFKEVIRWIWIKDHIIADPAADRQVVLPWSLGFGRNGAKSRDLTKRLVAASFVGDGIIVALTLWLSYLVRFNTPIKEMEVVVSPDLLSYAGYITFASLLYVSMLVYAGVYNSRTVLRLRIITGRVFKWSFVWTGFLLLGVFMLRLEPPLSRVFCVLGWILTPISVLMWRSLFYFIVTRSSFLKNLKQRIAFVGWNSEAAKLVDSFNRDRASTYQAAGYFRTAVDMDDPDVQCLGSIDDFETYLEHGKVDVMMLVDLDFDHGRVLELASACIREMVDFKVVPSYYQILLSGLDLETIGGIPIMGVSRLPLDRVTNRAAKRIIDILGALIGLTISLPIIAFFGLLVFVESPGPIFYSQQRLGRNGKIFKMFKIRSMRVNAEQDGKPGWTVQNDPRRLKVGAFMRKWNIDEVPQFWNVLTGEMSLVGPRPERPELIATFKYDIAYYNARHNAKPGITGWAQVNGLRGNTDLTERIKCDLWYLENWSTMLDFQIMWLTFLKRENAG
jgi:exopolysaccharide biosynthesis polyprenyl glycosylphosphotransferase